jgi:hypothetical protein
MGLEQSRAFRPPDHNGTTQTETEEGGLTRFGISLGEASDMKWPIDAR